MHRADDGAVPAVPVGTAVAQLGRIIVGEQPLETVIGTVACLARSTVCAADEVSVILLEDDKVLTAAATAEVARRLDQAQCENDSGPCLDAARAGEVVRLDLGTDRDRYPAFSEAAASAGVHSSLSVPLATRHADVGALNLYNLGTRPFTDDDEDAAVTLAAAAAVTITNASRYDRAATLAGQLREAMTTRAVIDQAKGVLMRDNACSGDQAFRMLREASNRSNRKLRDIAQAIVDNTAHPRPHP